MLRAIRCLEAGRRDAAATEYALARAIDFLHPQTWSNLAALAVGLDDAVAAGTYAAHALRLDAREVNAWINLGVAHWHAGRHRDAAQATHRALALAPTMRAAIANFSLMLQAVGELERARALIEEAIARLPSEAWLRRDAAGLARLLCDHAATRRHVLAALALMLPALGPKPEAGVAGDAASRQAGLEAMYQVLAVTCDRLASVALPHHLMGGVVLGIAREGDPFHGDKDIDLALPMDCDRAGLAALFAEGFTPIRGRGSDPWRWCMGWIHAATGIGVDLFFMESGQGGMRQSLGWPDALSYRYPSLEVGQLRWRGRDWPVPVPLDAYLASNYGEDWREPRRRLADGRSYDKRWFDTQVSCPGLEPDSVGRAVSLVLLRLVAALEAGKWEKALALCDQVLAREPLDQVEAVRLRLLAAGIR